MRLPSMSCAFVAVLLSAIAVLGACGTDTGATSTTGEGGAILEGAAVMTIEEALAQKPGTTVRVGGMLVADGLDPEARIVLASALLESYPPQAGGATLELRGVSVGDLVGLSSTVGASGLAPATWSDYLLVVEGVVGDGSLEVQRLPQVVQQEDAGLVVRCSPVSEPLKAGETALWAFDVQNTGPAAVTLTFADGQQAEIVLTQDGVEKYRWSAGMTFTQAIEEVTLGVGETWKAAINGPLEVEAGEYQVKAEITAFVGDFDDGDHLPVLTFAVRVF